MTKNSRKDEKQSRPTRRPLPALYNNMYRVYTTDGYATDLHAT